MRFKLTVLFAILYYLNWYPFFITSFITLGSFKLGALWAFLWYAIIPKNKIRIPNKGFTTCTILVSLLFIFRYIIFQELESVSYLLFSIASWIGVFLLINSFDLNEVVYRFFKFKYIMILCSIFGMILYAMNLLPIIVSWSYSTSGFGNSTYSINSYGFFNVKISDNSDMIFLRSSGWYDEPGSFAFVIVLLLAFNYLFLKKDKITNKLVFGGLVTLSVAHIIISAYYYVFDRINLKRVINVFLIVLLMLLLMNAIPRTGVGGFIRLFTIDRFENLKEGNDSSRNFDVTLDAAKEYWLTGCSFQKLYSIDDISKDTIYFQIAQYGIWGILIYYCFIIYGILKLQKKRDALFVAILFGMLFFQRPVYIMPLYLALIYVLFFERIDIKYLEKL